ncbi:MAG: type I 3-dehydroquinate dehydratase [Eubacteriales bacterium]
MNIVEIRHITLGEGRPKTCTSIVGTTRESIYAECIKLKSLPVDIIEWRVDWYEAGKDVKAILEILKEIRTLIAERSLLFTIRTSEEGGENNYTAEEYESIISQVFVYSDVDAIDVEIYKTGINAKELIQRIQAENIVVIASNHDFSKTPPKEEMVRRLQEMQTLGADVLKLAVMPQNTSDVITLLDATREMSECYATQPLVTMSMSSLGTISRLSGETFGSCMSFGSGESVSAPGQIQVSELAHILDVLHTNNE